MAAEKIERPSNLTKEERDGVKKLLEAFEKITNADDREHALFWIEGMAAASKPKTMA